VNVSSSFPGSGGTTEEAGLSHARFGIDGKRVNDIAATINYQYQYQYRLNG
jgi:hypothetical protein